MAFEHPGPAIRKQLSDMTVTKIAKRLGFGRPAVSRFLNGNSVASPPLAYAFEIHLGFKAVWIIEEQARFLYAEWLSGDV
jgi:transcriptional regulator with XRE-family HTH domain